MAAPKDGTMMPKRARRAPSPEERQRDPERTKERILDAAVEVFSARGFAGARVAEIAAKAGINKQLIAYYFGGKEGLYQAIARRWRDHEGEAYPEHLSLAEEIRRRIMDAADDRHGSKLLAWDGLNDEGRDGADAGERNARLRREVAQLERRQADGEISREFDPAVLLLILMGAAHALTVYPHIARGALNAPDAKAPDVVRRYADQVAKVVGKLS
ncbi:MAG: TetR/AcrR family transcriptional regulator [Rhizobiaceae bacterium]